MADISRVPPSELKDFMGKVTVGNDVPKRTHDAEIHRLREDYDTKLRALRGRVSEVEGQLKEKEQKFGTTEGMLAKVEAAADKRISRLTDVRADLEKRLLECRKELEELKVKHEEYKGFLLTELPKEKRKTYCECMSHMLKKIRHVYPEADMAYFADDSETPDMEIDPELLAPYDDTETVADDAANEEENVEVDDVNPKEVNASEVGK